MLKSIRVVLATVSILLVSWLFLDFTGFAGLHFGWLAKIQFIPALLSLNLMALAIILVMTLLLGRVYCSVICPLGIMQDGINWLRGRTCKKTKRKNRFGFKKALTPLRIIFLGLFVIAVITGLMAVAALIEPYSGFGRIVSTFLGPVYDWGNNLLAEAAEARGSYDFASVEPQYMFVQAMILAGVTFTVVAAFAWSDGRAYCNTVCPVGTILGYLSKFSWLRPAIDTSVCNGCSKCSRNCKASCIDYKEHKIDYSRCVACMNCIGICSKGAIRYTSRRFDKSAGTKRAIDGNRRTFIAVGVMATGAALAKAEEKVTDGGFAPIIPKEKPKRRSKITPPGSIGHANLERRCTSCQLCISSCPNRVLRPSMEITTFMQPEVSYENGYCRPECTRCSDVCPTGAIRAITVADKSSTQIGQARVTMDNCISVTDGVNCGKCSVKCPVQAIVMTPVSPGDKTKLMPVVNESLCIGCGACEYLCPVSPVSAIVVHGHEVHRLV